MKSIKQRKKSGKSSVRNIKRIGRGEIRNIKSKKCNGN